MGHLGRSDRSRNAPSRSRGGGRGRGKPFPEGEEGSWKKGRRCELNHSRPKGLVGFLWPCLRLFLLRPLPSGLGLPVSASLAQCCRARRTPACIALHVSSLCRASRCEESSHAAEPADVSPPRHSPRTRRKRMANAFFGRRGRQPVIKNSRGPQNGAPLQCNTCSEFVALSGPEGRSLSGP